MYDDSSLTQSLRRLKRRRLLQDSIGHHAFGAVGRYAYQYHFAGTAAAIQQLHLLALRDGYLAGSRGCEIRDNPRHFHARVLGKKKKIRLNNS